jgi:hypothetical protein
MRALLIAALAFGTGCALKPACPKSEDPLPAPAPVKIHAHAHNDYEHQRPLLDALEHHFDSVEADLWLSGGELQISHTGGSFKGTLGELYLDPLQARVNEKGSVHGDGAPFFLWLDLKDGSAELRRLLAEKLAGYPMLERFGDGAAPGKVTVILTGDKASKEAFVEAPGRRAARDSNDWTPDDPPADGRWNFYALKYGDYLSWGGNGTPSDDDLQRLRCITTGAHAKGRGVRLYASPETPEYWRVAKENGVDFINTDKLEALEAVLKE